MTVLSAHPPLARPRLRRPDLRKIGLAAASVAINVGLIAVLSFTALGIDGPSPAPDQPILYVDIAPRPLLPAERPRVPVQPSTEAAAATPAPDARQTRSRWATQPTPPLDARPAPLRPRLAAPAPQGVQTPDDPWRVDPNSRTNAMARTLRQGLIGCSTPDQLNAAERAHCREDAMRRGQNAAPIAGSGDPERDAAFARQGARRLGEWEARRRPLSGGVGVVGPADCPGSNFGTGCAGSHLPDVPSVDMRQGAETTINRGERRRQGFSASIGGLRIGGRED